jgi:catechol 2,3-dioxygenase-like lactoylglutathione lyase family enzyme
MPDVLGFDHLYIAVSDMARAEAFYDRAMGALGFRKNSFALGGEPHVQYYNRQFGYVLRPARTPRPHNPYAPGLHHLCLRVEAIADVVAAVEALRAAGITASQAAPYPEYSPDYWATFFEDPDGLRLEITNYRKERRDRHDAWDASEGSSEP